MPSIYPEPPPLPPPLPASDLHFLSQTPSCMGCHFPPGRPKSLDALPRAAWEERVCNVVLSLMCWHMPSRTKCTHTHTRPYETVLQGLVKLQSDLIGRPRQKHYCNPVRSNCVKSVVLCNSWALMGGYTSVQIPCIFLVPTLILPHNCKYLQDN